MLRVKITFLPFLAVSNSVFAISTSCDTSSAISPAACTCESWVAPVRWSNGTITFSPYTNSKGVLLVEAATVLFNANSQKLRCLTHTHSLPVYKIKLLNTCLILWWWHLVWPSVCGWWLVLKRHLVPMWDQRAYQNALINQGSWSYTTNEGMHHSVGWPNWKNGGPPPPAPS